MAAANPFVLRDVQIFTGEKTIPSGYVYVKDQQIQLVGAGDPPSSIDHVRQFSFPKHTVLPGFIDSHVHAFLGDDRCMSTSLEFGITTVLDMHNETEYVRSLKALVADENSFSTHADFKTSGLAASIENGYPFKLIIDFVQDPVAREAANSWAKLKGPEEAEAYVDERIRDGSDYIKLLHESGKTWGWDLPLPTEELQAAIIKAAHKRGLKAVAHAMSLNDTLAVLRAGVDGMAHIFCDEPITDELLKAYEKNNVWVCPTLAATGSMTSEGAEYQRKIAYDDRVKSLIGEEESKRLCHCMGSCHGRGKLEYAIQSTKVIREAGIDIVCGSDSVGPSKPGVGWGASYYHELKLFVEAVGMSPEEALRSATGTPARRFGFEDRGVIASGRLADLMLVEGNPLETIDDVMNLRGVWRRGHVCARYEGVI